MRHRVSLLLGDRRRSVVALAVCSILSGFTEAGMLALIAQIAADAGHRRKPCARQPSVRFTCNASLGTLIAVAFALTLVRLAAAGAALDPACADRRRRAGAACARRLFDAFTRASWAVQSQDREGQLQETMTSQVMQATVGAMQATS